MGAALYIVLEKQIPNFDSMIDGKRLSKSEKQLAAAAKRGGVRPLMDFFSTSAEEVEALLGEDVAGMNIPPTQWFSAEEGLRTVEALLAQVETSPELRETKDELLGCQRVLREAQKHGVKWHLAVDF